MGAVTTAVIVGGVIAAGASTANAIDQNKKQKDAKDAALTLEGQVTSKRNSMQAIKNPYANATNPFKQLSNPYANLGVATQAAEFQAEQADQALANTLDTMAATGMGSGGATALARMALESKRGISASIEQQEVNNQKLSAQGEQTRQVQVAQGEQSLQTQKAQGEQWAFAQKENRDLMDLDRLSALADNKRLQEQQHAQNKFNAIGNIAGSFAGMGGNLIGLGGA
jgi:septal ring factor EnvC (AmiA/AmiB activator)